MDINSEVDDAIFSPRVSLMLEPTSNFRVRNSLGFGFRAPEAFDEDLHISNVGGDLQAILQDPNIQEETAITLSVAPEWQITDKWRLETNFFTTRLTDTFIINPNDNPATPRIREFLRTNGGDSSIFGAELNLGYFAENWQLELSWVEQRLEFDNPELLLGDDSFTDPIDNPIFASAYARTPEQLGLLKFTHHGEWFDSFIAARINGPMEIPRVLTGNTGDLEGNRLETSPWFFNIDIGLSKDFEVGNGEILTVSLGCKNILNDFQDDLDEGAFRDSDYIYGPAFPRTVFAGLNLRF